MAFVPEEFLSLDDTTGRYARMPNDLPSLREGGVASNEATPDDSKRPAYFEATLNILGYREADQWVALALEMDLRGYGKTWGEAVDDLSDLVLMQISFAYFKGQLEMIWKSAEEEYWEHFRRAQQARLFDALTKDHPERQEEFHAGGLAIPPAHVIAAQSGRFLPANG